MTIAVYTGSCILFLSLCAAMGIWYYGWHYAAPVPPAVTGTTRIACVGDSITCGALLRNRKVNCYPAQLERMLGKQYSVRNFGVNGHTLQKKIYPSYWRHRHFKLSSEFEPHIVLIMLGTNDARKHNWKGTALFSTDYRAILEHYKSLPCNPVVYAMTPPTQFSTRRKGVLSHSVDNERVTEASKSIKCVAKEMTVTIIDINDATRDHPECFTFDGVHPDVKGARVIAESVYAELISK